MKRRKPRIRLTVTPQPNDGLLSDAELPWDFCTATATNQWSRPGLIRRVES